MRRVYFYWFITSVYMKGAVLGALMAIAAYHISFIDVARNTANNSGLMMFKYLMSSFVVAGVVSKLLLTALILGVLMMGWELVKRKSVGRVAEMRFR